NLGRVWPNGVDRKRTRLRTGTDPAPSHSARVCLQQSSRNRLMRQALERGVREQCQCASFGQSRDSKPSGPDDKGRAHNPGGLWERKDCRCERLSLLEFTAGCDGRSMKKSPFHLFIAYFIELERSVGALG